VDLENGWTWRMGGLGEWVDLENGWTWRQLAAAAIEVAVALALRTSENENHVTLRLVLRWPEQAIHDTGGTIARIGDMREPSYAVVEYGGARSRQAAGAPVAGN
jgi:hypothetical protein